MDNIKNNSNKSFLSYLKILTKTGLKAVEELKKITNFYETKKLEKKLEDEYAPIYTSMKSFINYEEFTPESVDKNLLQPLLKEINRLNNQIKNLKLQLSKYQNAINEYSELKDENESLKEIVDSKQKELDVLYNLIIHLNEEKDRIVEKCRILGIDIENLKEQTD